MRESVSLYSAGWLWTYNLPATALSAKDCSFHTQLKTLVFVMLDIILLGRGWIFKCSRILHSIWNYLVLQINFQSPSLCLKSVSSVVFVWEWMYSGSGNHWPKQSRDWWDSPGRADSWVLSSRSSVSWGSWLLVLFCP